MREPTGPEEDAVSAGRPGESAAVSRKKVLLRLLAVREAGWANRFHAVFRRR